MTVGRCSITCLLLMLVLAGGPGTAAQSTTAPLRIMAFGAHPDDAELKAGGVAALWAAKGHKAKLVSMTNGDVGHFAMAGGPLATRRKAEVQECARIFGTEVDVLDIHDGELVPSLENRKTVARLIRNWQADIVMGHRPYDYHPDHRYTGVLMEDSAVVVVAPFFTPDAPAVKRNPIYLYYSDDFKQPYAFDPTIVVSIDADKKYACIAAMPSQFGDADSWQGRTRPDVPAGDQARRAYLVDLVKARDAALADRYRAQLVALYGEQRGRQVKYAEAFQLCPYGRQPTLDELKRLFPITP